MSADISPEVDAPEGEDDVGVHEEVATVGEEAGEPGEGRRATGITSGGRSASMEFSCWSC